MSTASAIEVDASFLGSESASGNDSHSDWESELESETTSITSSIREHVYENGRRYHAWKGLTYNLPNDEEEQNRLDIYHHLSLLALGGELFRAPIGDHPQRVLDICTGTGIWACDFADLFPSAEIRGNDLSPIQPPYVPPNAKFEVDDIESTWTHKPGWFDFIHGRSLAGFIRDRAHVAKEAFSALKPGGYYELQEQGNPMQCDDGSLPENHILRQWVQLWEEAADKDGIPWLSVTPNLRKELEDAGFVDVEESVYKIPNSPWPANKHLKDLGRWNLLHLLEGCESLTIGVFTRSLGWDKKKVNEFTARILKELKVRKIHTYTTFHVVYGRKPA